MPTQDDLQSAFAGESQANRKYLAFAIKAEAEGFPQIIGGKKITVPALAARLPAATPKRHRPSRHRSI